MKYKNNDNRVFTAMQFYQHLFPYKERIERYWPKKKVNTLEKFIQPK